MNVNLSKQWQQQHETKNRQNPCLSLTTSRLAYGGSFEREHVPQQLLQVRSLEKKS